jgi:hypothetical protein
VIVQIILLEFSKDSNSPKRQLLTTVLIDNRQNEKGAQQCTVKGKFPENLTPSASYFSLPKVKKA